MIKTRLPIPFGLVRFLLVPGLWLALLLSLPTQAQDCPSLTIVGSPALTLARGTTGRLTVSGANSYTWSTGATSTTITASFAASAGTTYSVTGTTGTCSVTASVFVVQMAPCPIPAGNRLPAPCFPGETRDGYPNYLFMTDNGVISTTFAVGETIHSYGRDPAGNLCKAPSAFRPVFATLPPVAQVICPNVNITQFISYNASGTIIQKTCQSAFGNQFLSHSIQKFSIATPGVYPVTFTDGTTVNLTITDDPTFTNDPGYSASMMANPASITEATSVTFTATTNFPVKPTLNGTTNPGLPQLDSFPPSFFWYKNGVLVTPNSANQNPIVLPVTIGDVVTLSVEPRCGPQGAVNSTNSITVCSPPSVSISATPSLTVARGGSVTLTASGADSYTWSDGSTQNPLIVSNVTSETLFSVTGVTGQCSATASAAVSTTLAPFCNTVVYVTPAGSGNQDGSSWTNALPGDQLAPALVSACSGTTFLVGGGLYKPTTGTTDRTATLRIPSGVEVYGGYTVVGGAATGRVISTSTGTPSSTTFSGDIDGNNTLDEGNSYNVVSLSNASASTRLDGLVITGGYPNFPRNPYDAGGGVYNVASGLGNSSNPTITNCLFEANFGGGGGLYCLANEGTTVSPTISNCRFANNIAPNNTGAALSVSAFIASPGGNPANRATANPIITNTVFAQNTAFRGAAFSADTYFGDVRPTFTNCRFTGNTTTNVGGAMFWYAYAGTISVTAIDCAFTDNTATDGGAVYGDASGGFEIGEGPGIANISNTDFQRCTFTGNGVTGKGGVLGVDAGGKGISTATLTNCVVSSNTATDGGAIYANGSNSGTAVVGVTSSTFTGNQAGSNGGAIFATASSLTLTSSLLSQNTTAFGSGGGIYATESNTLALTNTDLVDNRSGSEGGGIYSSDESLLSATNSRVLRNSSSNGGGGIFADGQATLTSVQLSQNTASGFFAAGGGFAATRSVTATFESCSIAQNINAAGGTGVSSQGSSSTFVFSNTLFDRNDGTGSADPQGGGAFGSTSGSGLLAQFSSCTFTGNKNANGGAIGIPNSGVLRVSNSEFIGNHTLNTNQSNGGGAINTLSASMTVTGTRFSQNSAAVGANSSAQGGAILVNAFGAGVLISGCSFSANVAPVGGAYFNGSAGFSLERCLFVGNQSTKPSVRTNLSGGGALLINGTNNVIAPIESCTFVQNQSADNGGAIHNFFGTGVRLSNSLFDQNQAAASGGGLFTNFVSVTATNSQFTSNTASGNGGGGAYVSASYSFSNVQWKNNSIGVNGNGGALYINNFNSGTIVNNLFEQNGTTSSGPGGAIFANGGSHVLVNTNLNRNAAQTGGAISAAASFTLLNCTLNRNAAASGGTVFSGGDGAGFVVQNSIIWNNSPVANNFFALPPTEVTLQNSLIDPTSTAYTDGGSNKTADPLFTNESGNDLTLTGCSPAINAGSNALYTGANGPATDLAGATRPAATVDMGAYEFQETPGSLTVTITPTPGLTITSGGSVTLTASGGSTYLWSNGSTDNPLIVSNVTSATAFSVTGVTGGCSGTASAAVAVIPCNLTALITPNPGLTICTNGGGLLTASGAGTGGSYVWGTNATTSVITVNSSGPYTVTATNSIGCSSTATVTVTALNPAPLAQPVLSASSSAVCVGGSVSLTATVTGSVNTYQWYKDGPSGVPVSLGSAQSSSVLTLNGVQLVQAGSYVLVIGASGCGSATSTAFTLTVNPLPTVTIVFPTSASVNPAGPVVTVPVGTGLTYQVLGGGSNGRYERKIVLDRINGYEIRTAMENTTGVFPIDRAGPYTITVTDANGCSRTVTGEIRGQ